MSSEAAIVASIKKWIKERGGYVVKIAPPVEAGTPDLLVCWRGRFVGIECKRPGCYPTLLQYQRMKEIEQAGGMTIVARRREDVECLMEL